MPPRRSRRLVIDASVARAAGGPEAAFPTSIHCRDFLDTVRATAHRVVMTRDIFAEWKNHRSRLAHVWQRSMVAKRRIIFLEVAPNTKLRHKVGTLPISKRGCEAMLKDIHLIEAALVTDRTAISLDEAVRKLFSTAAISVRELRPVVWVNPANPSEEAVTWLNDGARPQKQRKLGFRMSA
jgi:hypothetical protein